MEEVKAKSILDKIKEIFNGEEEVTVNEVAATESEEVKEVFVSATLEDGTQVEIEPAIEEGAAVVVIDAEGNPMVAPDGSHILADGTVIETVEGAIISIVAPEVEEEVEEEMEVEATETEEQRVKKVIESIVKESHFASEEKVEEMFNALKEEFNAALESKVKEIESNVIKAFEAFGKTEEKEPTKKPEYTFRKSTKGKRNLFHS